MAHQRLTSEELAATVPQTMQRLARWVGHRSKQPVDVTGGGLASVTNPATWGTFDQALEWYGRESENPEVGIGFVFAAGDGLVFLDLDGCLNDDGTVKAWASEIVRRLATLSYLEVSPSRKGLHAFLLADLPRGEGVTGAKAQPVGATGSEKVEVYAERRFSTVTGWRWPEAQRAIPEACSAVQEALGGILYETGLAARLFRDQPLDRTAGEAVLTEGENGENELARVRSALAALDPDCGYEEWVQIGMALKAGLGDAGQDLWEEWSARGSKFQPGEPGRKWGSFRGTGVGLGTLFRRALDAGWQGRRDALAEFAGVEVPADVGAGKGKGKGAGTGESIPYHTAGTGRRTYVVRSRENAYLFFSRDVKWKGRLRWNERKGEVEWDGKPLQNHHLVDLDGAVSRALEWDNAGGPALIFDAVVRAARTNSYDPVRDWLRGLTWDGRSRLDSFCRDVGLEDSPVTRRYIRLWLLGAVARAFEPGCSMPYVLVLCGPQGAGKSRLAQALAVRPEWYHESAVTLGDKDAYLATLGPWIFEIAELAGMRRADQERVKAFVSEKESRFRAPYGRVQEAHPRRLVFIATTNDEEYGRDSTGARRWLDVPVVGELAIPTESEVAQLWAEAVVQYQRGERRYETAEEVAETNARGEGRREVDPVEITAGEIIRELTRQGATTVAEVLERLRERNVQPHSSRPVTTALRKAGWTVTKFYGASRQGDRVWVVPGAPEGSAKAAVDRRRGYQEGDH